MQAPELVLEGPVIEAVRMVHGKDDVVVTGDAFDIFDNDLDLTEDFEVWQESQPGDIPHVDGMGEPCKIVLTRASSWGVSTSTESRAVTTTLIL